MATMNVSLPEQMKEWVEAQMKGGRYGNASDYIVISSGAIRIVRSSSPKFSG